MGATLNIESYTMPAGEYWVGDPCYAIPEDKWIAWLKDAGYDAEPFPRYLVADVDGNTCIGVGTSYGDGLYRGSDGNEYPVDAGLIGAVPTVIENEPFGMQRVTFEHPFEVSYTEERGVIRVGHISIPTDDDVDEDDWREEEEDE